MPQKAPHSLLPLRPYYARRLPPVHDMEALGAPCSIAEAPSTLAFHAGRALARLCNRVPAITTLFRTDSDRASLSHLQHRISELTDEADLLSTKELTGHGDDPNFPAKLALFSWNEGGSYYFNAAPKDNFTTVANN
jgi:hypothetical protein